MDQHGLKLPKAGDKLIYQQGAECYESPAQSEDAGLKRSNLLQQGDCTQTDFLGVQPYRRDNTLVPSLSFSLIEPTDRALENRVCYCLPNM